MKFTILLLLTNLLALHKVYRSAAERDAKGLSWQIGGYNVELFANSEEEIKLSEDSKRCTCMKSSLCNAKKHDKKFSKVDCKRDQTCCRKAIIKCKDNVKYNHTSILLNKSDTECEITIEKPSAMDGGLARVELELVKMSVSSKCTVEYIKLRDGYGKVTTLCSDAKDEHIFVDFGDKNEVTLNYKTKSEGSILHITYLPYDHPLAPPKMWACTSYHTEASGVLTSYNTESTVTPNSKYTHCIRAMENHDGILYWLEDGEMSVTGKKDWSDDIVSGADQCQESYINIPGARLYQVKSCKRIEDVFCGKHLRISGCEKKVKEANATILYVPSNYLYIVESKFSDYISDSGYKLRYALRPTRG